MRCVCGHPEGDHRTTAMSVPLHARDPEPLYPLPAAAYGNIATRHPTASYDQQQCWCGCCAFERLID